MKYTEKSDNAVDAIFMAMVPLNAIYSEKDYIIANKEVFIENMRLQLESLKTLDIKDVRKELWEVCEGVENIKAMSKIYEVKFKSIISWRPNLGSGISDLIDVASVDMENFLDRQQKNNVDITALEAEVIMGYYIQILLYLVVFRSSITFLLKQWSEMDSDIEHKQVVLSESLGFRLAPKKKTDFVKLLSAMYDAKMFVNKDGSPATNKQKLMDAFGEFLGDDFSAYSTLLSQAKDKDVDTFMKPLTELEKAFRNYLNFTTKE